MWPNLSLPQEPVITRQGTRLNAAFYYGKNFDKVKEVINTFNKTDSMSIQKVQDLIKDNSIQNELAAISTDFQCITKTILKIEKPTKN